MVNQENNILIFLKKWLLIIVLLATILEMIFFLNFENFLGCIMAIISCFFFTFFCLKKNIILQYPFSFLMFTSIFLYRYLPLIATLLEGNPITFGFQLPLETFSYEILLFFISFLSFYFSCPNKEKKRNNFFKKLLYRIKFFDTRSDVSPILWRMGFLGLIIKIYLFSQGDSEYGDILLKFLTGLTYLANAPILLLFPNLLNINKSKKKFFPTTYVIVITILNIASNSRQLLIEPFFIIVILFVFNSLKDNISITKLISPIKISFITLFLLFGLNFFTDASLAMIYNRSIRKDMNKLELLNKTIETYEDEDLMNSLKLITDIDNSQMNSYQKGWDETYINNFLFNRYANMRISDQTLYYAKLRGYNYPLIQSYYMNRAIATFPTPFLKFFDVYINKEDLMHSPGDLLYGSGIGSFRVSSHVGTGLATFGYWYFFIQFILLFFVFKLLNTFVYFGRSSVKYSPYALMSVFTFVGMFRNASGWITDFNFILREYIQGIFTYLLIYLILRMFLIKKSIKK